MMRDFQLPGRSPAVAANGMAATSHPLATLAALDVLRAGGNAVDAAIAACAVQCVVEPQSTGIGGDCFVLLAPAGGPVRALNGSGWTPQGLSIEALQGAGHDEMPEFSPHSVTVPGALSAWQKLLDAHGTKELGELLQPAIGFAREGFLVAPRVAYDWNRAVDVIAMSEGGRRIYLPGGAAPSVGDRVRLPLLAETLETIARDGSSSFYRGSIGAHLLASLQSWGGRHAVEDFAEFEAEWVEPIGTDYRGTEVFECPPNGQGLTALLMLNMLEALDLASLDPHGPERLHLEAEVTRLAYRDRDRYLGDPRRVSVPVAALLDKAYAGRQARNIDPARAMTNLPPSSLRAHSDTVYLTVVDRDLNAVSFINSLYESFGSGLVCPRTGVLFHNRGRIFSLQPDSANSLAPRKRPLHTIIPGLALRDGRVWASFGVMGGDYQPVGHGRVVTGMIDWGMDPQTALDQPRILAYPSGVHYERGISRRSLEGLAARGHELVERPVPLGSGQVILVDEQRGALIGASDHRRDSLVLGY